MSGATHQHPAAGATTEKECQTGKKDPVLGAYLQKANFLTSRHRLTEALEVYEQAIRKFPHNSDLWNCKGVCLKSLAKNDEAFTCYEKALELDPYNAGACNNKGVIHKEKEDYEKAIQCYIVALQLEPNYTTAVHNLAIALTDLGTKRKGEGRTEEALERYHQAIRTGASYSPAYYNLGVMYSELGDYQRGMEMYQEAVRLNPRYVEAYNNMGAICKNQGHLYQAIAFYEKALSINPNFQMSKGNLAVALTDLGTHVKMQGDLKGGIKLYKRALVFNPHYADAYYNLGVAYGEQCKYDKAIVHYELAVHFNPRCAEAFNNLGVIYKDKENLDKAIYYYNKVLEINPSFAQTLNNIGVIYTVIGKMTEAYEYTRRAIDVNPNYAEAYNNLGVLYRDQGDVELAVQAYEKCISIDPNSKNALQNRLLALNYLASVSVQDIFEAHRQWGMQFTSMNVNIGGSLQVRRPFTSWKVSSSADRVLRVGYISPDLFTHSVSYFIHAPLKHHDPAKVQVYVYANVVKEDDKTQMFKQLVPVWRTIMGMGEYDVAKLIYEDQIDILVELTGHTANNRLDVMAWKPAPVQITWIGYPNTTGLPSIDYRITDSIVDPPSTNQPYVEQLLRLPKCFLCYTPAHDAPEVSPSPCLQNGFITFGSFNNLAKIGPQVVRLWSRVLKAVPSSRLFVKAKPFANSHIQKKFMALFEAEGISADRIDLMCLLPMCAEHLRAYSLMDIALDTFPYAGTTTTCESLFMGVPVVTLRGQSNHAHNVGVTLLTNIGLSDLVCESEEDFVRVAVQMASDVGRLCSLRESMRNRMLSSTLCHGVSFTKNLEHLYRQVFTRYTRHGPISRPTPSIASTSTNNDQSSVSGFANSQQQNGGNGSQPQHNAPNPLLPPLPPFGGVKQQQPVPVAIPLLMPNGSPPPAPAPVPTPFPPLHPPLPPGLGVPMPSHPPLPMSFHSPPTAEAPADSTMMMFDDHHNPVSGTAGGGGGTMDGVGGSKPAPSSPGSPIKKVPKTSRRSPPGSKTSGGHPRPNVPSPAGQRVVWRSSGGIAAGSPPGPAVALRPGAVPPVLPPQPGVPASPGLGVPVPFPPPLAPSLALASPPLQDPLAPPDISESPGDHPDLPNGTAHDARYLCANGVVPGFQPGGRPNGLNGLHPHNGAPVPPLPSNPFAAALPVALLPGGAAPPLMGFAAQAAPPLTYGQQNAPQNGPIVVDLTDGAEGEAAEADVPARRNKASRREQAHQQHQQQHPSPRRHTNDNPTGGPGPVDRRKDDPTAAAAVPSSDQPRHQQQQQQPPAESDAPAAAAASAAAAAANEDDHHASSSSGHRSPHQRGNSQEGVDSSEGGRSSEASEQADDDATEESRGEDKGPQVPHDKRDGAGAAEVRRDGGGGCHEEGLNRNPQDANQNMRLLAV
ncbi:unnamed protein product [Vitrella brassicaformis CCMP3155]|uniref:Probable UDP-N-acetylglucosamine--peptide N-acetylglucosaminyltransferase SPINDLY n=4 Tax=Vitrella brassicaformis TaxID=1169539 RepID=A0A0G4F2L2_VITBC|nr:unnamed protein product [Vitrella brassicaformis CCMP3155]|eukprot:CEM06443.1 unnamed protein product [Vitrella brassicaformis CCMP3155]